MPGYFTWLFQQAIPLGNHLWTRARLRDLKAAGFGLREIVLIDIPQSFPQLGFQLGASHLCRGWTQAITLTDWSTPVRPGDVKHSLASIGKLRAAGFVPGGNFNAGLQTTMESFKQP